MDEHSRYSMNLSAEGVNALTKIFDPACPERNIVWTTDPRVELPIKMDTKGTASMPPITCMDLWQLTLAKHGKKAALSEKIDGKWQTLSYEEYYDLAIKFAAGLVKADISERSGVSILGFNSAWWFIDYFGTIFANCIACGHYLSNGPEAIQYMAIHSDTEMFVVEDQIQLEKVLKVWHNLPKLKYFVA